MKKIALIHYVAPPYFGPTQSSIYNHILLLNQAGYLVRVIAGNHAEAYFQSSFHHQVEFCYLAEADPAETHVAPIASALEQGQMPPDFTELVDRLAHSLEMMLADVHACIVYNAITSPKHLALTAALHQVAGAFQGKMIAWNHEPACVDPLLVNAQPPWNLLHHAWPRVTYVSSFRQCQGAIAQRLGISTDQVKLIPSGVEPGDFLKWEAETHSLVQSLNLLTARPLILITSRIEPGMHLEFAIRVIAALSAFYPQVTLLIANLGYPAPPPDQAYVQSLHTLGQAHGLTGRMHLLYPGSPEAPILQRFSTAILSDLYQLADMYFFPSERQSMGIPLLAAGLVRMPIFSGVPAPFEDFPGELIPNFEPDLHPENLAQEIAARLKDDPVFQVRQRIFSQYTWQTIVEKRIISLIE